MTTTTAVEVLDHNDALVDVITHLLRDCTLAGLRPVHVALAAYSPGFYSASVQLREVSDVDVAADVWHLHGDNKRSTNYTRPGAIDVNGQTVTVAAYSGRPKHPAFPAGYAPTAVQS